MPKKQRELDKAFYERQRQINIRKKSTRNKKEINQIKFEGYLTPGVDVVEPHGYSSTTRHKRKKKHWWN